MSTFSEGRNARAAASDLPKDSVSKDQVHEAKDPTTGEGAGTIPADNKEMPNALIGETQQEADDRHIASLELPVSEVTDPSTQDDGPQADETRDNIVPGAAVGPDRAGVVLNETGRVAHAPAGTLNAAFAGVQEDASGHVDSVGTDNSSKSGVRI
jgi:hypothetical protein